VPGTVEVRRGGRVESRHRVHVAVVGEDGERVASVGDMAFPTGYRSAAKPLQALPLVEDGVVAALGLTDDELALCCSSHNSEPLHVETARRILARAGLGEDALACGGHPPLRAQEGERLAREGVRPGPIHNNCSGKHAGMLALAVHHGWPTEGYQRPEHPVQRRMLAEIARWTGLGEDEVETGGDGCGVVCFRVPLAAMALSLARFAGAAGRGRPAAAVVRAMTRHPWMVAGTGRLCTDLMAATGGSVFAKTGAEGVYVAGVPERGWGVALKVEDGARRAADVALVAALDAVGLLEPAAVEALAAYRSPEVRDTRGEVVGGLEARLELERPASV
jgi:L-asparaginase II